MQDLHTIAELEARIARALDRIGQGLDHAPGGGAAGDVAALQEALDTERGTVAQLTERLHAVREREAAQRADFEARIADLTAARAAMAAEIERLTEARRGESAEMQDILAALVPLIEEPSRHA